MRIAKCIVASLSMIGTVPVFAQSSVTLSGLIDAGVSYVSNEGGHSNLKFDDGISVPNLLELSGHEDLGGGLAAVFRLVDQFTLGDGSILAGDNLFTRTSMVGLTSQTAGSLGLGNQYDFMLDSLLDDDIATSGPGLYTMRAGPFQKLNLPGNPTGDFNWDRMSGGTIENSVKYVTPVWNGISAGAMYGFGGVAGAIGDDNGASFGLNYADGDFGMNAAYTNIKTDELGEQVSVRNWGAGARYKTGRLTTKVLFTAVHDSENGGSVWEGEVGAAYQLTPALSAIGAYMYMKGNAEVDNNHASQITAMLNYALSKRTSVYVDAVYQRASSGSNALINGVLDDDGSSSSQNQLITRVGMSTTF